MVVHHSYLKSSDILPHKVSKSHLKAFILQYPQCYSYSFKWVPKFMFICQVGHRPLRWKSNFNCFRGLKATNILHIKLLLLIALPQPMVLNGILFSMLQKPKVNHLKSCLGCSFACLNIKQLQYKVPGINVKIWTCL